MKKIVGIIAAAAMAASVFAVDFTAGMQLKADLLNIDDGDVAALSLFNTNGKDDKPFIFSVNGDRAGGTLKFYDSGALIVDWDGEKVAGTPLMANYWNIWFSPFDSFKIELGNQDIKLNCETVTWWKGKVLSAGDWGYKAAYSADGLTIAAALLTPKDGCWFAKLDGFDADVGETALYAEYDADFGNIKVLADFKNNFDDMGFGAGYKNTFDALTIFSDVAFTRTDSGVDTVNGLAFDVDGKFAQDDLSVEVYAQVKIENLDYVSDTMSVPVYSKVSYALNGGSLYFKFDDSDLKSNSFDATLQFGYDGNLGALAYEIEADYNCGSKVFSMPCYFRIGF